VCHGHTKSIRVALPESVVDQRIEAVKDMTEATVLAFPGEVLVILRSKDGEALEAAWRTALELLGEDVISEDGTRLEEVVGKLLKEKNITLAVAESITGGLVGHRITQVAGSSEYFLGGVEAYSYRVKEKILGVDRTLLEERGAVCEEVAKRMAEGVRELVGATVGVATTGIAGPATEMGKPVGLFYVAVAWEGGCEVEEFHSGGSREHIKERAATLALDRLRRVVIKRF